MSKPLSLTKIIDTIGKGTQQSRVDAINALGQHKDLIDKKMATLPSVTEYFKKGPYDAYVHHIGLALAALNKLDDAQAIKLIDMIKQMLDGYAKSGMQTLKENKTITLTPDQIKDWKELMKFIADLV